MDVILLIIGLVAGGLGSYAASSGQIGFLNTQVSGLQTQITTLQGDVNTLQTSHSGSEAQVASLNQQLQALQVPLVTILSFPSMVSVGEHFTVMTNVTGGIPGKISHFGIHKDMSDVDIVAVSQTTGDTPQTFSEVVPAPNQTGPFAIRAHAIIDGKEVWSDEKIVSVEQSSTFNLEISAARIIISKLVTTQSTTLTVTVKSVGGFNSPVTLALANVPSPAVTATLNPNVITPPANGEFNATLSIAIFPGNTDGGHVSQPPFGTYSFSVIGTSGSITQSDALEIIVTNTPSAFTVAIIGFTFKPSTITVPVGATVIWTNTDPVTHTVTSSNGVWDSGDLSTDQSFVYTFNATGTYNYHDKYQNFAGTVIVTP